MLSLIRNPLWQSSKGAEISNVLNDAIHNYKGVGQSEYMYILCCQIAANHTLFVSG